VAHHAVIPNVNVLDDLEPRLGRLSDDEKRLFALICRSYLAATMPDYEYRQTVVTINVPVPGGPAAEFRATGRIPLRLGWKTVYGALPQEQDGDSEPEQTLPPLSDGEAVTLTDPKVEAKRTQPPPRYSEGTLVEAMQNAWRFVNDPGLRDRLKEAKGIGTPATRADIIKGLKKQNLLAADGKFVVPTSAGLQIFKLLRGAAPSLVDPATTATWEMQLDDIVSGRTDFRAVIDGIATMAGQLIEVFRGHPGSTVDLDRATAATGRRRRQPGAASQRRPSKEPSAARAPRQQRSAKHAQPTASDGIAPQKPSHHSGKTEGAPPTAKMVAYAKSLAGNKKLKLPPGCAQDFETCRRFLDQHAR
jgi:DNA topoisomerase-3